jgi:hypothetical protein
VAFAERTTGGPVFISRVGETAGSGVDAGAGEQFGIGIDPTAGRARRGGEHAKQ